MDERLPDRAVKGRGAVSNRVGRFEPASRELIDDGWGSALDLDLPPLKTEVGVDRARSVIATNDSPDIGFRQSINPYRGCEHGCVYCFARPSHAYLGLSPGLDFETKLFVKPEAAKLLARELGRPGYRAQPIALGANTDPYQPLERRLKVTRSLLEVLTTTQHPFVIVTKSDLVLRDLDLIAPAGKAGQARVMLSITTLDRDLARKLEPRAPTPQRRLAALEGLAKAGVPVGVLAAPMIPALNDMELEKILETAAKAGASTAGYILIRLAREIKDLFQEWLTAHVPDRKARVLDLIRQTRGGALYVDKFGERMRGQGPYADLLARRFDLACRRHGLSRQRWHLDTSQFQPPPADERQMSLL